MAWLQEVAVRILSQNRPDILRAIDLFEFEIGVLFPRDKKMLIDARLFCALKMLEHLTLSHSATLSNPPRFAELASIPEYSTIFDEVIFPSGGLEKIRYLENAGDFDDQVEQRRDYADDLSKIAQYTIRAHLDDAAAKQRVGRNAAYKVLFWRYGKSEETYRSRWKSFNRSGTSAAMLYLTKKFKLKPPRIGTKQFAERILKQVADREKLANLFSAYVEAKQILQYRHYPCEPLDLSMLKLPAMTQNWHPSQFGPKSRQAIQSAFPPRRKKSG